MPIHSMTGYGEQRVQNADWELTARLKTLNHRYLDVRVSGLESYSSLELQVRDLVQQAFARGRADLDVELRRARRVPTLQFDAELAAAYMHELRALRESLGLSEGPSLEYVLGMEGVTQREVVEEEGLWPLLQEALQGVIRQVRVMRTEEGARLEGEFRGFVARWKALTAEVAERAPRVTETTRQRLRERIESLNGGVALDEARLEEEVIYYAERSDISEELARLKSHFEAVQSALDGEEPAGKVLDFLAQEVGREVNTIGAKAKDAGVSHDVVEMKSLLEKFREQVRNIE